MRKMPCSLAVIVLLSGCATGMWHKPGASLEDFRRDLAEVKYEATKHTTGYGYGGQNPFIVGMQFNDIMRAGMEAKGYRFISRSEAKKLGLEPSK